VILPYPSSVATTCLILLPLRRGVNAKTPRRLKQIHPNFLNGPPPTAIWRKSGIILFIFSAGSAAHADYGWRTRMSVMPQHRGYDLTGHWFWRAGVL
jgi:hypothetical protein